MYVCLRGIKRLKWFDFALLAAVTLLCNFGPEIALGRLPCASVF